jgi:fatty-acyl-CoA synthase
MSLSTNEIQDQREPARVNSSVYVDEEIFQLEMERIWARSWIYAGYKKNETSQFA